MEHSKEPDPFDQRKLIDADAERELLGCLAFPEAWKAEEVSRLLPEHFADDANRTIFCAMRRCVAAGLPLAEALPRELVDRGLMPAAGGIERVSAVLGGRATYYATPYLAEVVRKRGVQRSLQAAAVDMAKAVANGVSPEELLEQFTLRLDAIRQGGKARQIRVIDSKAFAEARYQQRYLIDGVLAADQPAVMGGRPKVLKTSLLIDGVLAVSTGGRFLGHFDCERAKCLLLSGESGEASLQRTAFAVASAQGINLADADVLWGEELPKLSVNEDLQALGNLIADNNVQLAIIDPAYLSLLAGGPAIQASNVFEMGPLLYRLSQLGKQTGSTLLLAHHCRKGDGKRDNEPPGLEDLSMSGFGEWARQWQLVGRREPYEPGTGLHKLWLNIGGSAGHSGCYAVDVDEGTAATGRRWHVTVLSPSDARQKREAEAEQRKTDKATKQLAERRQALMEALRATPGGESATRLRELLGLSGASFGQLIRSALETGSVERCELKRAGRTLDGYQLKGASQWTGQPD